MRARVPVASVRSIPLCFADSVHGSVFPGATLPFGEAKASADTGSESNQGGFNTDGSFVTG